MVALTKPQERKKESERLREGDQIKFIDFSFERWQVAGLWKEEEGDNFQKLHVLVG